MVECSVEGCGRPHLARGWCSGHHARWLSTGDVRADVPLRQVRRSPRGDVLSRFDFFTDRDGPLVDGMPSRCWLWTGQLNPGGYGRFPVAGRTLMAHRWAYERFVGSIPSGLTLDHLCRIPNCVNPAHVEPCTMDENTKRAPEQVTTINAAKTHCIHGHPFSGDNLYIVPSTGARQCRECVRRRLRESKARRRARAAL